MHHANPATSARADTLATRPARRARRALTGLASLAGLGLLAACAQNPQPAAPKAQAAASTTAPAADTVQAVMERSFRTEGIATADRLQRDATQKACSIDGPPDAATGKRLMAEAQASVVYPADGQYLGNWKAGETLAQSGRGMTWTDTSTATSANGGNCYNCHQMDKKEISFGTIGPSLTGYAKKVGVQDPADPAALPAIKRTWAQIYNSQAAVPCSHMPRFGHKGLLDVNQMKDLMALLLDPKSPLNQ